MERRVFYSAYFICGKDRFRNKAYSSFLNANFFFIKLRWGKCSYVFKGERIQERGAVKFHSCLYKLKKEDFLVIKL